MSYLLNNQQKFNDMLFANRNKEYGAYAIRSAYGSTVFKSLSLIILASGIFAFLAYFFSSRPESSIPLFIEQLIPETSTIVNLPPDKPVEPPASHPPRRPDPGPAAAGAAITVVDTLPVQTTTQSLNVDVPLASNTTATASGIATGPDTGGGIGPNVVPEGQGSGSAPDVVEFVADSEPEFDGGLSALYRFVSSHLRYPALAAEVGKEGTVFVRFVVDEKGKVGNLMLQNNLGYGLDEEAKRVVSMIPNFKTPAKIKGRAVKVYYQLPIRFKLR